MRIKKIVLMANFWPIDGQDFLKHLTKAITNPIIKKGCLTKIYQENLGRIL